MMSLLLALRDSALHLLQALPAPLAWVAADPDWKQVLLVAMTPAYLAGFAIELAVMARRRRLGQFRMADILTNLNLGLAYQVFEFGAFALVTTHGAAWVWRHRLADWPLTPAGLAAAFVAMEFCYYWFHRTSHRVRWFWSAHVVHHSGETMNMTTAMRQSLLYTLTGWWLFFMPLVALGVPPGVVFVLYACDLAYQFFIHTEAVGQLPRWVEYVFNTPSHHRVHHGRNPAYLDRNYGGVLILFDRWFGTFAGEREPVDYGIVRQVHSQNLLVLNLHEFVAMWRDVLRAGPLSQRLAHLWRPPEWVRPVPGQGRPQPER